MANTTTQTEKLITNESNEQEIMLTVDLGPLLPILDTLVSSPDIHTFSNMIPSPTQSNILKESLANRNFKKEEALTSQEAFKKDLIVWLRNNNLKLTPANELEAREAEINEKDVNKRGNSDNLHLGYFDPS